MNFSKIALAFGLAATTAAFAEKYEAETATLDNEKASNPAVVSGSFVKMNDGNLIFDVTVASDGKYNILIHYSQSYGDATNPDKIQNLVINGSNVGQISFKKTAATAFTDVTTAATLKAGANTIAITKSWGWVDIDYIEVSEYQAAPFNLCNAPITPGATPEAVKLYNFLVNNFGSKVISGVMTGNMDKYTLGAGVETHEDVADVRTRSGKNPVLVGTDFLFATGPNASGSWQKEYTNKAIDIAKDLWKKGGIPAFTWHWKDPLDKVDAFYATQKAAQNSGSSEWTDFNISTAFKPGTTTWDTESEAYKGLIADIDYIADFFLDLQKENVAAIFRPLHEAGGNWFWWSRGVQGNQFAALYSLVYDRMVFTKGVKNLVWVFNPEQSLDKSWDPGSTHYDVVSVDIYKSAGDHGSNSGAFDTFKEKWGLSKVIALSENGPIPDIKNLVTDQAMWSWWMPWYGSWGDSYIAQTANDVWTSNMTDEKVITLDEMPGWASYSEANKGTQTCKVAEEGVQQNPQESDPSAIFTNNVISSGIAVQGNSITLSTSAMKDVSVDVFSMMGKLVATLHRGSISAGTHAFSLGNMARGNYIVRVKGAGINASQQIVVK